LKFYAFSLLVVTLDQLTKYLVVHHLDNGPLLGDVVRVTLTENTGAAFGLFPGARLSFIAISLLAAAGLVYANHAMRSLATGRRLSLALILGGNLGNLVDRVRLGRVTDFVDMGVGATRWPVYNLADVAVVLGAVSLAVVLVAENAFEKRAPARAAHRPDEPLPEENSADARG
jgi:signal peptidase II